MNIKDGQLKVWWIPQVPMKAFEVYVDSLKEAKLILDTLAKYDMFQYENNVKPDYSNAGGLQKWDEQWFQEQIQNRDSYLETGEEPNGWSDWYDDETGCNFDEYCEEYPEMII